MKNNLDALRSLAKKYLNETGRLEFDLYLEGGHHRLARDMILGAIDVLWEKGELTDDQARLTYEPLGLTLEERAKIRSLIKKL